MDALELQRAEADDIAVGKRVSDGRRCAWIGDAEGTHLIGIVLGPPDIALVRLTAQAAQRLGKGHAKDVVEVEVGAEDVAHRQPLGSEEALQRLLLARTVARRVDEDGLAPLVPHHIGVRGQHIELKDLQIHSS